MSNQNLFQEYEGNVSRVHNINKLKIVVTGKQLALLTTRRDRDFTSF